MRWTPSFGPRRGVAAEPPTLEIIVEYLEAYLEGDRKPVFELLTGRAMSDAEVAVLRSEAASAEEETGRRMLLGRGLVVLLGLIAALFAVGVIG